MMNTRHTATSLCLAAAGLLAIACAAGCGSDEADGEGNKDSEDYLSMVAGALKKAQAVKCVANLRNLHSAVMAYSAAHKGKVPASLDELVQAGLVDRSALVCPARDGKPYVYIPPASAWAPSTTIIARDATAAHDGKVTILRLSGSVTSVSPGQAGMETPTTPPAQP